MICAGCPDSAAALAVWSVASIALLHRHFRRRSEGLRRTLALVLLAAALLAALRPGAGGPSIALGGGGGDGDPGGHRRRPFARRAAPWALLVAVLAVVAGHMHHRLRGGGARRWKAEQDGVLFLNAARVPRVFHHEGRQVRHHLRLVVSPST